VSILAIDQDSQHQFWYNRVLQVRSTCWVLQVRSTCWTKTGCIVCQIWGYCSTNMNNTTFWEVMQYGLVHSLWNNISEGIFVQSSIPVSNYTASHLTWYGYSVFHLCLLTTNETPPTFLLDFTLAFEKLQIKSSNTRYLNFI